MVAAEILPSAVGEQTAHDRWAVGLVANLETAKPKDLEKALKAPSRFCIRLPATRAATAAVGSFAGTARTSSKAAGKAIEVGGPSLAAVAAGAAAVTLTLGASSLAPAAAAPPTGSTVPPTGKGSLYIRPLLMGSEAVLGLDLHEGLAPINLIIEDNFHRAAPGGTGGVKTIGNYASVLKAQRIAKEKGYSDVLYLDAVHNKYLEEVSSCNIFVVKENVISTPAIKGTILPGITKKSIIEVAQSKGFKVEERPVTVDDLLEADEVFCTGTAVVVSPVGSVTYQGKRVEYNNEGGVGVVSQQLYTSLTRLQMGHVEDRMGWTVQIELVVDDH